MAILCISSQVARGYVGNTATLAALHLLGVEAWAIPTILLSSHKAHPYWVSRETTPADMAAQFDAFEKNGWLSEIDGVTTGYLTSPGQVEVCVDIVSRIRTANENAFYWCDPVMGDDPGGLYIDQAIATAMATHLVPVADILSPNAFELGWLAKQNISGLGDALRAAKTLDCRAVIATSVPGKNKSTISNLLMQDDIKHQISHELFTAIPHGTGDLFTAVALGHFTKAGGNRALQPDLLKVAFERASSSLFSLARKKDGAEDDNLSLSDIQDAVLTPGISFTAGTNQS